MTSRWLLGKRAPTRSSIWSNSALVWGAAMTLETMAVLIALRIFFRVRNRYYASLIVVLACAYIDLLLSGVYGAAAQEPIRDMSWTVVSWMGVCGFNIHNYIRLRNLMGERYARWHRMSLALPVAPIVLYTIYTIANMYYYLTGLNLPIGVLGVYGTCLDIWSLVDCAVSTAMSAFFVCLLQPSGWKSYELCRGYNRMLLHIKLMLLCECSTISSVAVINILYPTFDPTFMTFYFAEALRYYIYTNFLDMLCGMILQTKTTTTMATTTQPLTVINALRQESIASL
ncbi:hypothetical protein RI367_002621 [Sorochytrium milnesiophthora]